jgi:two-component system, NarL family, sensor histidine kinase BarA
MSYRAFKRLLGETSLERKCRFLLGAGILLLITLSFWVYARQTESLAYDQTANSGRLLISPIVGRYHVANSEARKSMELFQVPAKNSEASDVGDYKYKLIKPNAKNPDNKPEGEEVAILNRFISDPSKNEETRPLSSQGALYYYGAIRASHSCLQCHGKSKEELQKLGLPEIKDELELTGLKENDLMGVMSIRLPTRDIESAQNLNRALLISTAIITALLIMAGSYLIIRYVIVKPVKHLKEVSDAIAAGQLNVRSEIQTGDEFEDLSHAFNRMLRNLMSMQERYQRLNADLDRKVDELAHANMALYESNRLKSDFLATMSHELRTPLHSILGFSDVLLASAGVLSEKQARWVANIKASGQALLNLINDILDLAKIEAGKMEVRPEEISVPEIAEIQVTMLRPQAEKKNIELRTQYDSGLPLVRQDSAKLQQVLSNLLTNAIKFTPEGGRVLLKAHAEGNDIVFNVTDTGVGIAPEDQESIFEKFRQAGNPLTREHEGTGLGLSIVRELCKLLGGDITLKSELGRGSSFTIRLPRELKLDSQIEFQWGLAQLTLANRRTVPTEPAANGPVDPAGAVLTPEPAPGGAG